MSVSEIHALIQLLDDPDENVYMHVREQLLAKGSEILPAVMEHRSTNSICSIHESRLNELIEGLHGAYIKKGLMDWFDAGAKDIIEGALWVHKAADPMLDIEATKGEYEKLRRDVWLEMNEELTALEQVRILNHIFFSSEQYNNTRSGHPNPQDALIGEVMRLKQGNPLGLGTLYLAIARDLEKAAPVLSRVRAHTIARTETHTAASWANHRYHLNLAGNLDLDLVLEW